MKLRELARRLDCRLEGDGEIEVSRVERLDRAGPSDLSFFANPLYATALENTRAAAVILDDSAPDVSCAKLRSQHPYLTFAKAVELFAVPVPAPEGVDSRTVIASDARLGEDVAIGPFVSIGADTSIGAATTVYPHVVIGPGVTIGEHCVIRSQVSIREHVAIGNRVVIQDGAVIGSDGYGFARRPDGSQQKIPQVGRVVIEDDVEVGANAAIDRPSLGETRICAGAKIDNLVQIGHGVTIGQHALLAGQVGIAGSTTIEDHVVLAGQVGVAGHITVGAGVVASAQSGIPNSVEAGEFVSGYPAIRNRDWLKSSAVFRHLPALRKLVTALQKRVDALERSSDRGDDDHDD